jgi:hypothetical protein
MDVATLNITRQQASEAVVHYRRALKLRRNAEDEAILRGYNAVLKGRKLIQLTEVIAAGGADEKGRPRLAVARADQQLCHVTVYPNGSLQFSYARWPRRNRSLTIAMQAGTVRGGNYLEARAIVPTIPPQHRPADDLAKYHILWEATWDEVPRDPALLKHLGGDLYAVLAVWDLTDLERAVLAGRRS